MQQVPECRSCHAPMLWGRLSSGKPVPLDAEPRPDGNIVASASAVLFPTGDFEVRYLHDDETVPDGTPRYVTHFVSCPDADQWRQRPDRRRGAYSRSDRS